MILRPPRTSRTCTRVPFTSFLRTGEDVPQRRRSGREVRVEAGIGGLEAAFGRPEQAHLVAIPLPDEHGRSFVDPFLAIRQRAIVAGEIVADGLVEFEVRPSALAGEGELALDRRAADDRQRYELGRAHV